MDHKEAVKKVLEALETLTDSNEEQKQFFEGIFEFMGECGGPMYREALEEFEEYQERSNLVEALREQITEKENEIIDLQNELEQLKNA